MNSQDIKRKVIDILSQIGFSPTPETKTTLQNALQTETSEIAKDILENLIQNIDIASQRDFPLCQDTGMVVFWVRIGTDINLTGINLNELLKDATKEAFIINNYRHSIVSDPILRKNTGDNTPPIIHFDFVDGDQIEINIMLKGGGSENMSTLKMLTPSAGIQGIRDFVLETVKSSGGNACPPLTVGIGIGGDFESCALLAKKALFSEDEFQSVYWKTESEYLLQEINKLNIGPMGLGGHTTALKVNIRTAPCHIACLPIAVNIECHAHRVGKIVFSELEVRSYGLEVKKW